MRLSNRLKSYITKSILESFGEVDIYLFGSRTVDTKQGGDIDIAIDVNLSNEDFKKNKIQFILSLLKQDIDLKIDIVPYHSHDTLLNEEIRKSALKLN